MRYYIEIMAALLFLMAALHVYWALGGKRGMEVVLPKGWNGKPAFRPGMGTAFVVAALLLLAGLLLLFRLEFFSLPFQSGNTWSKVLCFVAMLVFAVRGLLSYCLFLGRPHNRPNNWKWDVYLFSPICLLVALAFALAWLY